MPNYFYYDGDQRRIITEDSQGRTYFLYDGEKVAVEQDKTGTTQATYVNQGPSIYSPLICMDRAGTKSYACCPATHPCCPEGACPMSRSLVLLLLLCAIALLTAVAVPVLPNADPVPARSADATIEDLIGELRSPDPATRASAAQRLGEMGAAAVSAVPSLIVLLSDQTEADEGFSVGEWAGLALGKIGGPAVDALLNALSDRDPHLRNAAIQGLGLTDDVRASAPLRAALHDPSDRIRGHAALSLGHRNDTAAMGDLLSLLESDPSSRVRMDAAMALGLMKARPAVDGLIAALRDSDAAVRKYAVHALDSIHDSRAVPPLIALLRDEAIPVRVTAADVLGSFTSDPRVLEPLLSALRDETIAGVAAFYLIRSEDARLVPRMVKLLNDESAAVRKRAAWVLGRRRDLAAVEPLLAALEDSEMRVRATAAASLGQVKDPRAVAPLITLLQEDDWPVKAAAADALGDIGDQRAVPALISALEDQDWGPRAAAARALRKISGLDLGNTPDPWRRWWEDHSKTIAPE